MKKLAAVLLTLSWLLATVATQILPPGAVTFQAVANMFVNPSENTARVNETFTFSIDVSDAVEVNAWEILLSFDPTLIELSGYESGGFLQRAGTPLPMLVSNQSKLGYIQAGEAMSGPEAVSENGSLIILNFTVIGGGNCNLHLYNTRLYDVDLNPITHTTTDGTFNAQLVTIGTVCIKADGSVDPPTAPVQRDGDSYTLTGNITAEPRRDGIAIDRNNMTLDGAGYAILGMGFGNGIGMTGKNNVMIGNFTIRGFERGICLDSSSYNNSASGNVVTCNSCAIWLHKSSNNSIEGNQIMANGWLGLRLSFSSNNSLRRNHVWNNSAGIMFEASDFNSLVENIVMANTAYGVFFIQCSGNDISGNELAENEYNGMYFLSSSDNTIAGNVIERTDYDGVYLHYAMGNTVKENNITDCRFGLVLERSTDNCICDNLLRSSVEEGIRLDSSSNNDILRNRIVGAMSTQFTWAGVNLVFYSNNNTVRENAMISSLCGICSYQCDSNHILDNNVTDSDIGILLEDCQHYDLLGNKLVVDYAGARLLESSHNVIYHNDFLSNASQAMIELSCIGNIWDDGHISGGNYWMDYDGTDADGDGIGDTSYVIDVDNQDNYPLMNPLPSNVPSAYPTAEFTYSPINPVAGRTVVILNASRSRCLNGSILYYCWDFGDGTHGSGVTVNHTYASHGRYDVVLTVISNTRSVDSGVQRMTVRETPVANFTHVPDSIAVGQPVLFNASSSDPRGGMITAYVWNFGDGNTTIAAAPVVSHVYTVPGAFNITLTVTDSEDLSSCCFRVCSARISTAVSVSTSPSCLVDGFKVNVTGELRDAYGNSMGNETVLIYYSLGEVGAWVPIGSVNTDSLGKYDIVWVPSATGSYVLRSVWGGNSTHLGCVESVTLGLLSFQGLFMFSVESNSTIADLAFNVTGWELQFTAAGAAGTEGYVRIAVPKALVADVLNAKLYVDGVECGFSADSLDDSWLFTFHVAHSIHDVVFDVDTTITSEFPFLPAVWLFTVSLFLVLVSRRKKRPHGSHRTGASQETLSIT